MIFRPFTLVADSFGTLAVAHMCHAALMGVPCGVRGILHMRENDALRIGRIVNDSMAKVAIEMYKGQAQGTIAGIAAGQLNQTGNVLKQLFTVNLVAVHN